MRISKMIILTPVLLTALLLGAERATAGEIGINYSDMGGGFLSQPDMFVMDTPIPWQMLDLPLSEGASGPPSFLLSEPGMGNRIEIPLGQLIDVFNFEMVYDFLSAVPVPSYIVFLDRLIGHPLRGTDIAPFFGAGYIPTDLGGGGAISRSPSTNTAIPGFILIPSPATGIVMLLLGATGLLRRRS